MNRRVLVTGGSRGIGAAICEAYASRGYEVVAPSRSVLNLASRESIKTFIDSTNGGDFDILVNNAGINPIAEMEEINPNALSEIMLVNLEAPILLMKYCIAAMKRKGWGRIVNISSIWASVTKPGRGAYSATKAGIEGATRTVAVEGGGHGVLANAVAPGFVMTELTLQNNTSEQLKQIAQMLPLKRLAEASEIAEIVVFLGSDANTFITGQAIIVDGGFSCL